MTKRHNMEPPRETGPTGPGHNPLWPVILAGALVGIVWAGLDPDTLDIATSELLRFSSDILPDCVR